MNSCVAPESLSDNSSLKLDGNCEDINSVFQQTPNLQLKHVNSGMCIYPLRSGQNPLDGTELIMHENCDTELERVLQMDSGIYVRLFITLSMLLQLRNDKYIMMQYTNWINSTPSQR